MKVKFKCGGCRTGRENQLIEQISGFLYTFISLDQDETETEHELDRAAESQILNHRRKRQNTPEHQVTRTECPVLVYHALVFTLLYLLK